MKKFITLAFALLLALSLVACGDGGNTQGDGVGKSVSAVEIPALTPDTRATPTVTEDMTNTEDTQKISVDITAANAYAVNVDSGTALYQKNSDERIAPASTAKMLTALTVLGYCSLDDTFTVGSEINLIASDSSVSWLKSGDTLTVKQLLAALLIPSGNDAAYTLAVNTGKRITGDNSLGAQQAIQEFMGAMNQKAKRIGATSSNFVTPDGYDADGQYTTAFDLAQIAKACLENDVLTEIMGSCRINETLANGREVTYTNTNKLIDPNSQSYYSRVVGLKTGSTKNAGACLVSAAVINGETVICVVMGGSEENRFSDSLTVFSEIDPELSLAARSGTQPNAPGRGERLRLYPAEIDADTGETTGQEPLYTNKCERTAHSLIEICCPLPDSVKIMEAKTV
jgi:D-alanyl-D-alanine carboxypeptidase (penicillin-binding protein 5/6)